MAKLADFIDQDILVKAIQEVPPEAWQPPEGGRCMRWTPPDGGFTHCPLGVVLRQCRKRTLDYSPVPSCGDQFARAYLGTDSPWRPPAQRERYQAIASIAGDFINRWDHGKIDPADLPAEYGLPGH